MTELTENAPGHFGGGLLKTEEIVPIRNDIKELKIQISSFGSRHTASETRISVLEQGLKKINVSDSGSDPECVIGELNDISLSLYDISLYIRC